MLSKETSSTIFLAFSMIWSRIELWSLGPLAKVTGSKVWTIRRLKNCVDAHLGQIVCGKDGVVDWCIVLVEMPLTRFEECWSLPMESLSELPYNLNIVTLTLTLTLWPINFGLLTSLLLSHISSFLTDSLASLNLLCHSQNWCSIHARWSKSSPKHSIHFCDIFSKFKTEFYCISFF